MNLNFQNFQTFLHEKEVKEKDFIGAVKKYKDLDTALEELPPEYVEYYLLNINSKSLQKSLKKSGIIMENEGSAEDQKDKTTGMAPEPNKYKRIHYKGHYIVLKYTNEYGWTAEPTFRSITNALKYVKSLADDYVD
jgi:hypothetical protein